MASSGQSEDLSDSDYDDNYDDSTAESGKANASNLFSLTTVSGMTVQNTEPTIDTTTIQSTTIITTIPTTETSRPIETTTGMTPIRSSFKHIQFIGNSSIEPFHISFSHSESGEQKCPKNCKCSDDQVNCSHQNLIQIPKNLPFNTALLNLSHNNLATLNVSDLINYSQLRQLILNDNHIETIINTEVCNFSFFPFSKQQKNTNWN